MTWPDIADELPAPRDDEPSSLRQDIADELADHLRSSLTGELHRTPDQTKAKQNVLDRFGDPRRVARQLWFDAMKEKIMSQRLLMIALVVTAVACLGSTGLSWMLVQQSREANQALLEQAKDARALNRELLTQNVAANSKMLDRLAALSAPAPTAAAKSMEWNPVKIRLVKDQAGGPPAEGYDIKLLGNLLDTAKSMSIDRKSRANGTADFGLIRPGEHQVRINTPWGESYQTALTVLPGEELTKEIVCPGSDRQDVNVSLNVDWPNELRNRGFWAVGLAELQGRTIEEAFWAPAQRSRYQLFVVTDESEQISISGDFILERVPAFGERWNPFYLVENPPSSSAGFYSDSNRVVSQLRGRRRPNGEPPPAASVDAKRLRPYHFRFRDSAAEAERRWPAGRYALRHVLVADKPSQNPEDGVRIVDVLGGIISNERELVRMSRQQFARPSSENGPDSHPFDDWFEASGASTFAEHQKREKATPSFDVAPGKDRITIPISPKLAEHVRLFLEESK